MLLLSKGNDRELDFGMPMLKKCGALRRDQDSHSFPILVVAFFLHIASHDPWSIFAPCSIPVFGGVVSG